MTKRRDRRFKPLEKRRDHQECCCKVWYQSHVGRDLRGQHSSPGGHAWSTDTSYCRRGNDHRRLLCTPVCTAWEALGSGWEKISEICATTATECLGTLVWSVARSYVIHRILHAVHEADAKELQHLRHVARVLQQHPIVSDEHLGLVCRRRHLTHPQGEGCQQARWPRYEAQAVILRSTNPGRCSRHPKYILGHRAELNPRGKGYTVIGLCANTYFRCLMSREGKDGAPDHPARLVGSCSEGSPYQRDCTREEI